MSNYRDEREALAAENEVLRQEKQALQQQLDAQRMAAQQGYPLPPSQPSRGPVIAAVVALSLTMLGGAVSFLLIRTNAPAPVSETTIAPLSAPVVAVPESPPITIVVQPTGEVVVDGQSVRSEQLASTLQSTRSQAELSQTRVVIAADRAVPYAKVVEVMAAARAAGCVRIAMQVDPAQQAQ
jgi:biopolymer transport protein ExbD